MTTELKKQFFSVFRIEKTCNNKIINPANCSINKMRRCCGCDWLDYPQITDEQYLELICLLASNPIHIIFESRLSGIKEVKLLKNSILLTCIANKDTIKHQVQAIFEGENGF